MRQYLTCTLKAVHLAVVVWVQSLTPDPTTMPSLAPHIALLHHNYYYAITNHDILRT